MPLIPLFRSEAPSADASRQMQSPGGYDGWELTAHDPENDIDVAVMFFRGCPFHEKYLTSYARYRRRPTEFAPPRPDAFATVSLFVRTREDAACLTLDAGAALTIEEKPFVIVAGACLLSRLSDGAISLRVRGQRGAEAIGLDLEFRAPVGRERAEVIMPPDGLTNWHRWIPAEPACAVSGSVTMGDTTTSFAGRGAYQRRFGNAPPPLYLKQWMWGWGTSEKESFLFSTAQSADDKDCKIVLVGAESPASSSVAPSQPLTLDSVVEGVPGRLSTNDSFKLRDPQLLGLWEGYRVVSYTGTWHGDAIRVIATWVKTSPLRSLYAPTRKAVAH